MPRKGGSGRSRQQWIENPHKPGELITKFRLTRGSRYTPEQKAEAVRLKLAGHTAQEICDALEIGATNRTLRRWFREGGVYAPVDGTIS